MKQFLVFALLCLALSACAGSSDPNKGNCGNGACVTVSIDEPVRLNGTVKAKIIIVTEKDMSHIGTYLTTTDRAIAMTEGTSDWFIDTKANQPVEMSGTIKFIHDGYVGIVGAVTSSSGHVQDTITVHVTNLGGTVFPPGAVIPVTPIHITPAIPLAPQGTPFPTPTRAGVPLPTLRPYP